MEYRTPRESLPGMWYRSNFYKYSAGIILVLLIIRLAGQLQFLLRPLGQAFAALAVPVLAAGFLYYLLRPLVGWLERVHIPKTMAILGIYFILLGLFTAIVTYGGTKAVRQLGQLGAVFPKIFDELRERGEYLIERQKLGTALSGQIHQQATALLQKTVLFLTGGILAIGSKLAELAPLLALAPFILFYFLKDDTKFSGSLLSRLPRKYRERAEFALSSVDRVLAAYITGQAVLAIGQGILLYIGFLILGVPYALVLAAELLITSFIPVFGMLLGSIPALAVGLAAGPWLTLKIVVLLVLVHLLRELVTPLLVGKKLKLHPLTVLVVLLAAGAVWGFIGLLLAVPAYAVIKEIVNAVAKQRS
jgi:predicted PurR-regulated permease PerM